MTHLRRHRTRLTLLLAAAMLPSTLGCKRSFWRTQADRQVYGLLSAKMADPRWNVPRVDVQPDPASRMFAPYDPDCPPLPPDDPAARALMQYPGGFRGSKQYQKMGEVLFNDNPDWMSPFPPVGDQSLEARIEATIPESRRLTLEELVELSYLHNRDYQTQIETVYLAALDLTFDSFLFTLRHRGLRGLEPGGDLEYENVPDTSDNLTGSARWGIRKLTPIGTQFIAELANQTLWMFSGPNQVNTMTVASYSIVQPLLLGAGRKIVLEDLTQSERNTLYAVRDLARFRRTFFVDTVSGGQSGGLLGLLQRRQLILNLESNIEELDLQVRVLTELQSRPPSEYRTELRATAEDLLKANQPAALNGKLSLRRDVVRGEPLVRVTWSLPMSEAEATALEDFVNVTFADDRPTARYVLGRLREDVIGPSREEHFVEFTDSLAESLGIQPGEPLPGTFEYVVGGQLRTGRLADYGRYEQLADADEGFKLVWYGPMLLAQEDALLALDDDPAFTRAVERLAVTSRARQSLDIAQLTTRLLNSRNSLRTQQRAFRDALDRYKIELGLPPDVLLPIDECLLEQFQLIDPRLSSTAYSPEPGLEQRLITFVETAYTIEANGEADKQGPRRENVLEVLERLAALVEDVRTDGFGIVRQDLEAVQSEIAAIRERLPTPEQRERLQRDVERDLRRFRDLEIAFAELRSGLDELLAETREEVAPDRLLEIISDLRSIREEALKLVRELKVVQIGARLERIELPEFDIPLDEAVEIAIENRLDLMNTRAQVVDARRQLEITANRLEAILDVRAEGDVRNATGRENPFDLRGTRSSYRIGVAFSAPLDRQAERNDYRASQIALQRARRAYTLQEDEVKFQIRQSWRQLQVLRENFEVSRQALRFAAAQLDQAAESALEPLRSGQSRGAGSQGLNLLNALNAVLNAQNDVIGNWVAHESARLNLYRDMGIMNVDDRGLWDDPFYQGLSQRCRGSDRSSSDPTARPKPSGSEALPTRPAADRPLASAIGRPSAGVRDVDQLADDFVLPVPALVRRPDSGDSGGGARWVPAVADDGMVRNRPRERERVRDGDGTPRITPRYRHGARPDGQPQ